MDGMLVHRRSFPFNLLSFPNNLIGHRSTCFPLLSARRLVEFDTSVICHVLYILLRLISIARYAFKSPQICFRGTKHEIHREDVASLQFILCAGPGCDLARLELFASTVGRLLSRMSYFVLVYFSSGDAVASF